MEGITSKLSKWTPIDIPVKNAISTIHRMELGCSASSSHFKMAQKTAAVNKLLMAYTSPSTAENQNESENVYAKPPMIPLPKTAQIFPVSVGFPKGETIFLARRVILQNKNKMVNELHKPLITLTHIAALAGSPKESIDKKRAINKKKGAPGG